jgi:hypothetical protein
VVLIDPLAARLKVVGAHRAGWSGVVQCEDEDEDEDEDPDPS